MAYAYMSIWSKRPLTGDWLLYVYESYDWKIGQKINVSIKELCFACLCGMAERFICVTERFICNLKLKIF